MNKLNLLVSLITDDNDYQLEQAASAQAAAAQLGSSVEIIFSGNDAVQQTQQILSFIQDPAKHPDAILVEPVGTGMQQIAKAAVASGIAWCLINCDDGYIPQLRQHALVPVFSVLSDHEQIGKIQGQQIGAILGDQGCVLYVEGPSVRDVAKIRTRGMIAAKPPTIDVKTIRGDWTQRSGHQAVKSWLALSTSRQLNVGMVACQNDDMAIGARRAFEEIGDLRDREAWLRSADYRMRRCSAVGPDVGSTGPARGDRSLSGPGRRRDPVAEHSIKYRRTAPRAHAHRAQLFPCNQGTGQDARTRCARDFVGPGRSSDSKITASLRGGKSRSGRGLIAIRIATRQQHTAIAQFRFRHVMPLVIHLASNRDEFPARRIKDFRLFAAACDQQPSRRQLYSFVGQLEPAVVQRRCGRELAGMGIVNFRAVHGSVPAMCVGTAGDQHPSIGQQARYMFVAWSIETAGLAEGSGLRII